MNITAFPHFENANTVWLMLKIKLLANRISMGYKANNAVHIFVNKLLAYESIVSRQVQSIATTYPTHN